jgi:pyruvate, orthophosphate dikinase
MPGMMDTVLNLGLNDESVEGLAHVTDDERFAYDSYRRFIAMYGRIVLGVDGELFEHPLEAAKERAGVTDAELTCRRVLKKLCDRLQGGRQKATGAPFPQSPRAARRRHRGRVQELERRPGHRLPRPREASATTSAPP